jgi:phosphoenolpyruvate-protein kinase (PTS system EI component)
LSRGHPTSSNVGLTHATAATSAIFVVQHGRGGHTSAVAALAASLSCSDIAGRNIVRAQATAATAAALQGNLGRTIGKLEEAKAHQNAHDRHGKQGVHKGQDEYAGQDA